MYCTVDDIKKYYNDSGLFSASADNLNESQVEDFITEKTAYINMIIGSRYIVPLTGAQDLSVVKMICEKLVVCVIDGVLVSLSDSNEKSYRKTRGQLFCEDANKMLEKIANGEIELPNAKSGIEKAVYVKYDESKDYGTECKSRINY